MSRGYSHSHPGVARTEAVHAHFAIEAAGASVVPDVDTELIDVRSLARTIASGEVAILAEARYLLDWHAHYRSLRAVSTACDYGGCSFLVALLITACATTAILGAEDIAGSAA